MNKLKKKANIEKIIQRLEELESNQKTKKEAIERIEKWQKEIQKQIVYVLSAVPLGRQQLLEIENQITSFIGKPIIIKHKINSDILGGLKIIIGSKIIDASIGGQLKLIDKRFKKLVLN